MNRRRDLWEAMFDKISQLTPDQQAIGWDIARATARYIDKTSDSVPATIIKMFSTEQTFTLHLQAL